MRPDEVAVVCCAKFDADKQSIGVAKNRTHCHVVDVEETADLARIRYPVAQGKCAAASDHEQRSQSRQSRYDVVAQAVREALGSLRTRVKWHDRNRCASATARSR